jgi:DNA-binding transcriptional MerR regulator
MNNTITLQGLSLTDLQALLADSTAQVTAIDSQIATAPVKAKQQLMQQIDRLNQTKENAHKDIANIQSAIDALNNPAPTA